MTLELHATPEEVMRAVDALQSFGQTRQVPEKTLFGLALALEECGSNIANQESGAVTVKLTGSLDTATAPELDAYLAARQRTCEEDK